MLLQSIKKNIATANRMLTRNFSRRIERQKRIKKTIIGLFKMSSGPQPIEELTTYIGNVIIDTEWKWEYK